MAAHPMALALLLLAPAFAGCAGLADPVADPANPRVRVETSAGNLTLELFARVAPRSVANFLEHVRAGYYNGLIFHRVIQGFVIQTGGVWPNGTEKPPLAAPIPLEVHPQATHRDGCVGMARTEDPDSATSQWYVCDGPQHQLDDAPSRAARGTPGYAVVGRVVEGLPVVRAIAEARTDSADRPLRDVLLLQAREVPR